MDLLSISNSDTKVYYSILSSDATTKNVSGPFLTNTADDIDEPQSFDQDNYVLLTVPETEKTTSELDLSSLQIVTLADGTQAFVTHLAVEDNYDGALDETDPTGLLAKDEDDDEEEDELNSETNENADIFLQSSQINHDLSPEYQQIQLNDGSTAMIEVGLLSLLCNNSLESELDELAPKKKRFPCSYQGCEKIYSTVHHLRVHMRNHTGSRPYACVMDGCTKAFSTGYSLKAHLRTHTGEKPYGCSTCDKHFKTSGDLHKHIRTHTGEKPFMCPVTGCGKCFTTTNIRKIHVRSHTGERPYNCNSCGKAFASATNFKNHCRIHTGEKPYVCTHEECGKRFTEYSSLYKHQLVHNTVKPFICDLCADTFRQQSVLDTHKRLTHGWTDDMNKIFVARNGVQYIVRLKSVTSAGDTIDLDENIDDPDPQSVTT